MLFEKVPARERLVNIGIRWSADCVKMKRVVRMETSVCFRITRLTNNQVKSQRTSIQNGKSDDKGAVAVAETVPRLGCVSQDSEPSKTSNSNEVSGNPEAENLGAIRRGTSTPRQASIRENEGTIA